MLQTGLMKKYLIQFKCTWLLPCSLHHWTLKILLLQASFIILAIEISIANIQIGSHWLLSIKNTLINKTT